MFKPSIVLVSFYTQGPPFDNGLDLSKVANDFRCRYQNLFERVILFTPASLIKHDIRWKDILYDADYFDAHVNSSQRADSINLNWIKLNSLLFKPAILLSLLALDSGIDEDSIILFHDIDIEKYPVYKSSIQKISAFFRKVGSKSSIFLIADVIISLSSDCKQELLSAFLGVNGQSLCHRWAGFVAFKKNNISRQFCKHWYSLTSVDSNRSQLTSSSNYPGYRWHSQEQSTLSIVYYLWRYDVARFSYVKSFFTPICRDVSAEWSNFSWVKYLRDSLKLHAKTFFLGSIFDRIKIIFHSRTILYRLSENFKRPPLIKISEL